MTAVYPQPPAASGIRSQPVLSVSIDNKFTLSKALIERLGLTSASRFRLVPPWERGKPWHLDLSPRPGEGQTLASWGRAQFRLPPLAKWHFQRPAPVLSGVGQGFRQLGTVSNQNLTVALLRFQLGTEVEPGYYQLERI
jgi:hypothetical protein